MVSTTLHGSFTTNARLVREQRRAQSKETLMGIGTLPKDNPEHFFLPLARFFDRADLRRHEMDIFMGICRQMARLSALADEKKKSGE